MTEDLQEERLEDVLQEVGLGYVLSKPCLEE